MFRLTVLFNSRTVLNTINMRIKGNLKQLIKVKINKHIELTVNSISDFKFWKQVYPQASIVSYQIQQL